MLDEETKEKKREYNKQYRLKNKEAIAEKVREYQLKNKEAIAEKKREYRLKNKEAIAEKVREYRLKNKEAIAEKEREYKIKNKEAITEYKREYRRERYANDPNFRILSCLRSRMYDALKGNAKSDTTLELLGCTIEDLKAYLESQFAEGMTWDKYGLHGWHLDHIRPCASFDLTDPEQQKECFHYTNLQPLWAVDNLSKGSKTDHL